MTYNCEGKVTCSIIDSTAKKAQEKNENEKEAQDDQKDQDSQND